MALIGEPIMSALKWLVTEAEGHELANTISLFGCLVPFPWQILAMDIHMAYKDHTACPLS